MHECKKVIKNNHRVLVTTLTKKMAEDLTEYLHENGVKVRYLHSDKTNYTQCNFIFSENNLSTFVQQNFVGYLD